MIAGIASSEEDRRLMDGLNNLIGILFFLILIVVVVRLCRCSPW